MLSFLNRRTGRRPGNAYLWCGLAALLLFASTAAQAVPSYARQTGAACADCHAGAYGPALTPYGMRFKLNGYTDTDGNGGKIPLAAQLIATRSMPARGESTTRLTEADLYLAGRLTDQIGGYVKVENSNTGNNTFRTRLNNIDLRFVARDLKLGDREATLGVSVNNNPGFQDPIGALPGAAGIGPPSVSGTLLNLSALAHRVIGASIYGLYDSAWYGEVGSYTSLPTSQQDHLGYAVSGDPGKLSDTGYVRFAYMKDLKRQFFSTGVVALSTRRQLPRSGPRDDLTDLGYDLSYQFLGNREHIVQLSYTNILERRRYGSTPAAARARGIVRDQTTSLTYTFRQSWGITLAHLVNSGSRDAVRYTPYGVPDTTSNLVGVSWAPFGKDDSYTSLANLKIAATWFRFARFNGSRTNVFGTAPGSAAPVTDARDLDAFSLSLSAAF